MNRRQLSAYIELTKPRITFMVLITAALGFYLGGEGIVSYSLLFSLLLGSGLVCSGSGVLNHYIERDFDKLMKRTKNRPLPAGIIEPSRALSFSIVLTIAGLSILYIKINILTAFLSLLTSFLYIVVYTPMKRTSWLNTTFGSIPGAIPPLGGWAAATGHLDFAAGILFLILFLWQHPHFYAIAWIFRDDYRKGGFMMLPCIEVDGERTFQQTLISSLVLIPVSLLPYFIGLSGKIYFVGAFILGITLSVVSIIFIRTQSIANARNLLKATVFYLPLLLLLIIFDVNF